MTVQTGRRLLGGRLMEDAMNHGFTRRAALRLLLSTGGVAVVAACAPAVPPAATAPVSQPATVTKPASGPKTGGTLRVAISADPASLDGHLFAAGRFDTTWLIYDRLTEYDTNVTPQPRLAESWEVSSD